MNENEPKPTSVDITRMLEAAKKKGPLVDQRVAYNIFRADEDVFSAGLAARSDVQRLGDRMVEDLTGEPQSLAGQVRMRFRKLMTCLRGEQR